MDGSGARGAPTVYHHFVFNFKLGVLAGVFEKEVHVADPWERFDILVCGLCITGRWLQQTRKNDEK